ncbi:TRAP transporter small permease subunit [Roseivivax marinus]|uniref:TRAP transporter small permease subunit n=1 Tax=Roseivivax marinus TaxID=1379903 RepID=UPI0008C9FBC5|nr:TRAP transporter small permease subunit [Roseivivax marinus]UMA65974.1 TRAP transporter small permease subunit [Roseivivax marinus]SEL00577.1 TRAP-type mannitol/chloroaromatic compound transport system, small permease component [Roseivivax marinus]
MPGLSFTLPHWLYWVGLIVFPLVAMALARRPQPAENRYSVVLAYLIWVTGGILGMHRFYLRNLLGLVYIPIFFVILWANAGGQEARTVVSELANQVRVAERAIEREEPRVAEAEAQVEELRAAVADTEEGSVQRRLAERRLSRAEDQITEGAERVAEANETLEGSSEALASARSDRAFYNNAAKWAFYAILALLVIDAVLIPFLVRRANARLADAPEEKTLISAPADDAAAETPKADSDYATNWIDRLSLFAGEFAAYWAVIAVFVYYYEVIARYVFGSPTNWAHEAMYLMFGMQYLIAGAYAMLTETHVRVDIFYAPLPRKRKAWVDLLTSIFFFIFAGTLLVTSWIFAFDALAVPTGNSLVSQWARGQIGFGEAVSGWGLNQWTDPNIRWGEISFNEWEVPLWPMKWVMVMGGLLLLLQGISKLGKDIRALRGNDDLPPDRPTGAAMHEREAV